MFSLTRTGLLFVFATLVVISEAVDYYNVHIEDNNRGGGIQVNLPNSGSNYFEPTEGYEAKQAPTKGQKNNGGQFERPAATNTNNGRDRSSYDESNTSSYPNSTAYHPRHNTQVIRGDGSVVQTIYRPDKVITQIIGKDGSVYQNINKNPGQQPSASYPQGNNGQYPQSTGNSHKVAVDTDTPTQRPTSSQQNTFQAGSNAAPEFAEKKKWKPVRVRFGKVINQCYCPNQ